ncbi:MAG: DUF1573 domain-containing protein, partial [Phycisphaerales bacterium]|nr:DUF1573 domain-containing protein [Phycisphaerales bacterium]
MRSVKVFWQVRHGRVECSPAHLPRFGESRRTLGPSRPIVMDGARSGCATIAGSPLRRGACRGYRARRHQHLRRRPMSPNHPIHLMTARAVTCGVLAAFSCIALANRCLAQASPPAPAAPAAAPAAPAPATAPAQSAPAAKGSGEPNLAPVEVPQLLPPPNAAANTRNMMSATAPTPPAVSNEVPIVFEPSVLDLGEMQADVPKAGVVKLRNISSKPVKVLKAIPGCGCTTVGAPQDPIQPGEAAEIEITMKPGPKPGVNMKKSVTFQLEGYSPLVLTVQGDVAAYVTIEPDIIAAPKAGETTDQKIVLRSVDGQSFTVTGSNPPIMASIPTDAALEHTLDIDWGKWEAQGRAMKVSVDTSHPKAPSLSVMIKRPLVVEPAGKVPSAPAAPAAKPVSEMITASQRGDAARIKELLAGGGNANDVDPETGRSALHFAARENRAEVVAILLDSKADINAADRTGKTALTLAAENSAVDATKLLIERRADLNKRDQIGGTPLTWACALGGAST